MIPIQLYAIRRYIHFSFGRHATALSFCPRSCRCLHDWCTSYRRFRNLAPCADFLTAPFVGLAVLVVAEGRAASGGSSSSFS